MTSQSPEPPATESDDLPEQLRIRREKRERLIDDGIEPYVVAVARTRSLAEVRAAYPELEAGQETGDKVGVTGRLIFMRNTGKLCFGTLREGGIELQVMISLAKVGEESLARWKSDVDLGDHIFVEGEVIASRRGELSVMADSWAITAKAIRPLPVAHKAMNEETRIRQRYADLIVRPEARQMVQTRGQAITSIRGTLGEHGFIEVETPMLQAVQGGATARPFITEYNAYDVDVFLRIAPELYLKRCVVGGIDRVFEIGRNFRNEGADSTHSPEFVMLEFYQAYADYDDVADLSREIYQNAAEAAVGAQKFTRLDGTEIDLSGEWPKVSLYEMASEAAGVRLTPETSLDELRSVAEKHGIKVNPAWIAGKVLEEIFEELCKDQLRGPIFVRDFPVDTSPLVRAHRSIPGVVEKWDLYIEGMECGTGYSELVDPVIQRERFVEQAAQRAGGDVEAMQIDEDFLRALEYGMPPTGGVGLGIDRMLQTFTGRGIRETILFPFVKPE
ncbi:lysine--tRNA ligase [Epidermidibacterium keratini]|uniref:Lysine--tRNA ligase n=1 Tax=Epidermidibacterium keratini TaxID=1891644 RepID=A0A7L4YQ36_9ACTN|nr:lysine--tRNA ligase [Epidermidibacterium keratini]QHC01023.1 lysine--tRNA ligase [Epidermidibacterium keratini]